MIELINPFLLPYPNNIRLLHRGLLVRLRKKIIIKQIGQNFVHDYCLNNEKFKNVFILILYLPRFVSKEIEVWFER